MEMEMEMDRRWAIQPRSNRSEMGRTRTARVAVGGRLLAKAGSVVVSLFGPGCMGTQETVQTIYYVPRQ